MTFTNTQDWGKNQKCKNCGYEEELATLKISFVDCLCGHGGRAWHENTIGKCNYGNCKCKWLDPIKAYLINNNIKNGLEVLSGKEFRNLYSKRNKDMIFL